MKTVKSFTEYLDSRLYESKTSPSDYAKDYEVSHSVIEYPQVVAVPVGTTLHNPKAEEETGKRKAFKYYPWIKYWQAFTKEYNNKLYCTCCGNVMANEPLLLFQIPHHGSSRNSSAKYLQLLPSDLFFWHDKNYNRIYKNRTIVTNIRPLYRLILMDTDTFLFCGFRIQ